MDTVVLLITTSTFSVIPKDLDPLIIFRSRYQKKELRQGNFDQSRRILMYHEKIVFSVPECNNVGVTQSFDLP